MISAEMYQKVRALAALVLVQQKGRLEREGSPNAAELLTVEIVPGHKYTKIDYGQAPYLHGFLMIEHATGAVWGVKGYGRAHTGHYYGNIEEIDRWDWGGHTPRHL